MVYKSVSNTIIRDGFVYEIDMYNNVYKYELGTMKYIGVYKLEDILSFYFSCKKG